MDKSTCPDCFTVMVYCPCCSLSFCNHCGKSEYELGIQEEEE